MNEPSKKISRYFLSGAVVLCLVIVLGWFALQEEPSPPGQRPAKTESAKSQARQIAALDDTSNETLTNQTNDSASTNAAVIYRQAFDLFNALTKEQKDLVSDWRTNVDASVEAELCEKIHPICDLMHQASAMTNCDWGVDPINFDTKFPHLSPARNIARAAIWNAAHCRSNDVAGATDDALSALHLGQHISRSALIGCLVDMAVQNIASSYVVQHLESFHGANGARLAAALDDPAYEDAPSRAMEQEADMEERYAARLASLSPDQAEKERSGWGTTVDEATFLAALKQIADSKRELANALTSSSEDEYEAWQKHSTELQASNPLAEDFLEAYEAFAQKARYAEVQREMVVAGLAVAENGTDTLASHLDPASGKPFQYTKTDDGFELQSAFEFNDKPFKIQFKQTR